MLHCNYLCYSVTTCVYTVTTCVVHSNYLCYTVYCIDGSVSPVPEETLESPMVLVTPATEFGLTEQCDSPNIGSPPILPPNPHPTMYNPSHSGTLQGLPWTGILPFLRDFILFYSAISFILEFCFFTGFAPLNITQCGRVYNHHRNVYMWIVTFFSNMFSFSMLLCYSSWDIVFIL